MKTFGKHLEEKNKGLWDNIHAKRKRGEKMRKPGSKGAPTDADFKRSQEESVEEKKLTPAEMKKREEIAKAMERDNPGMDMSKKMAIATATAKKVAEQTLDEGAKTHFVYQAGVPKTKQVVHRGTEQSSKDWITKNAKHYIHKGRDFIIFKGKYPNVKPSDSLNFKHVAEEANLEEGLYHVEYGRSGKLTHQVVATDANDAHKKAMAHLKKKNPKLAHPDYADTFKKPSVTHIKGNEPRADKYKTEATEIDEVYASDYNVEAEKSQFGGHRPKVTHKKTGRTMYLGATSYKKPEHAKGHASAYLNGYQAMGDKHADRKAREYATQNQKHQHVKESLDISEISLDMLTKKISNSGMATTKKANKMDKTKNDLAAMRARLAGKPVLAKESPENDEPASPDEGSMAMTQLEFIEYAAEEMMDHIKAGKPFPEWMQNKLTKAHTTIEGLHSSLGEHGGDDEMKEATELDELNKKTLGSYVKKASGSAAGIAAVATAQAMSSKGKSDPNDKRQLRNRLTGISRATDKLTKEEVAEANRKSAPKMTGDSIAIQRAKDAALNKALGRTKTGRKAPERTMTSTQRSLAQLRGESVMSADKKPEKFIKPDGKVGIRMVRVDKKVVDKDA